MSVRIDFDGYLEKSIIKGFPKFEENEMDDIALELLDQFKKTSLNTIINSLGLNQLMPNYKDGGNVTTINNAEKGIFANSIDKQNYETPYDRKYYEKDKFEVINGEKTLKQAGLSTLRRDIEKKIKRDSVSENSEYIKVKNEDDKYKKSKTTVKKSTTASNQIDKIVSKTVNSNREIIDSYNIKRTIKNDYHLDHTVSGKEIHGNKLAKLTMSPEERGSMSLHDKNINVIGSSANQSKGEKTAEDWMNTEKTRNGKELSNKEYFNINEKDLKNKDKIARRHVNTSIVKATVKKYTSDIGITGTKQGASMAFNKTGIELTRLIIEEIYKGSFSYFKNFKYYQSIKIKVNAFTKMCNQAKNNVLKKSKHLLHTFKSSFIDGFLSNIITIIINTFKTTQKRIVRIISESFYGFKEAVKELTKPVDINNPSRKYKVAAGLISGALIGAIGGIFTEGLIIYLKTTPFAPIGTILGASLGGIITGITSVTVVYIIENFGEIVVNIKSEFKNLYKASVTSMNDVNKAYQELLLKIDDMYKPILDSIYQEYERLNQLTIDAYNKKIDSNSRFENTIQYGKGFKIEEDKMLLNSDQIDDFFFN